MPTLDFHTRKAFEAIRYLGFSPDIALYVPLSSILPVPVDTAKSGYSVKLRFSDPETSSRDRIHSDLPEKVERLIPESNNGIPIKMIDIVDYRGFPVRKVWNNSH